jgi:NAD+ kinase
LLYFERLNPSCYIETNHQYKVSNKSFHKVGIIAKTALATKNNQTLEALIQFLRSKKKEILFDSNLAPIFDGNEGLKKTNLMSVCDLVIVLGGDGTLLKTARRVGKKQVPVLSVNMGNLGFLTEVEPEKTISALNKIFSGRYTLDTRTLLRISVYRKKQKVATFLALNDVVINQGSFARLINMRMTVDQRKMMDFHADGVIVATPTGSTGHSLSAGGPVIHPKIGGFVITPICSASLTVRPIIVPDDKQFTILIADGRREGNIGLTVDGQETYDLQMGDEVRIRKSSRKFYLARTQVAGYYKMLRAKLGWGE